MNKVTLLYITLLLGVLLYSPHVHADTCGSGSNGYTVNGAPATQEEYQKCYSEGMAAMSNSGGHSTTVVVPNPNSDSAPQTNQSQPTNSVADAAAPTSQPTPQIYRQYKTYKPAAVRIPSVLSPTPIKAVTPTKPDNHPKAVSRTKPKTSVIANLERTIKGILHFLSFGIL